MSGTNPFCNNHNGWDTTQFTAILIAQPPFGMFKYCVQEQAHEILEIFLLFEHCYGFYQRVAETQS